MCLCRRIICLTSFQILETHAQPPAEPSRVARDDGGAEAARRSWYLPGGLCAGAEIPLPCFSPLLLQTGVGFFRFTTHPVLSVFTWLKEASPELVADLTPRQHCERWTEQSSEPCKSCHLLQQMSWFLLARLLKN